MTQSYFISTDKPLSPAEDYALLRAEGIRILQSLSGKEWTDYNIHDPGVTILEQLCYALTDLGYRLGHPLEDLLTNYRGETFPSEGFRARQILSSQPVTLDDYRRLLLDIPGVRNAWVEVDEYSLPKLQPRKNISNDWVEENKEVTEPPQSYVIQSEAAINCTFLDNEKDFSIKGMLKIKIEPERTGADEIRSRIQSSLLPIRGLGMDFSSIEILKAQPIQVNAEVEVEDYYNPTDLLVEIYDKIDEYLSPRAKFYTLSEMLAKGYAIEEIIQGPRLQQGYLDGEELIHFERRKFVHSSELVEIIKEIPGVRMVQTISLESHDGEHPDKDNWAIKIGVGNHADLHMPTDDKNLIQLTHSGKPLLLKKSGDNSISEFRNKWEEKVASLRQPEPTEITELDVIPKMGRFRDPGKYHSIQHHFPQIYGLGKEGLSPSLGRHRLALVRQLKGYLLFFDKILADGFAQLGGLPELLSFGNQSEQTIFSQTPNDVPDFDNLFIPASSFVKQFESLDEASRAQRLMNHMLARFGERMPALGLLHSNSTELSELDYWQAKQLLLKNYPSISYNRGSGLDFRNAQNLSGFAQRIALLLGITGWENELGEKFYLLEHVLLRPLPPDLTQYEREEPPGPLTENPEPVFLYKPVVDDPFSLKISIVFPLSGRFADEDFWRFAEGLIRTEAPAHIKLFTYRLEQEAFEEFQNIYEEWRTALADFGKPLDKTLTDRSVHLWLVRESRNRLMDMLTSHGGEFGQTYPVLDLPAKAPATYIIETDAPIEEGKPVETTAAAVRVNVKYSQKGMIYRLWDRKHGRFTGEEVISDGGEISLKSEAYSSQSDLKGRKSSKKLSSGVKKGPRESFHEVFDIQVKKQVGDIQLEGWLQNEVDAIVRILRLHLWVEVPDHKNKIQYKETTKIRIQDPEPGVRYTLHFYYLQDKDFEYFRGENTLEVYPHEANVFHKKYRVEYSDNLWYKIDWENEKGRKYYPQPSLTGEVESDADFLDITVPEGKLTNDVLIKVEAHFEGNGLSGFLTDRACVFVGPNPYVKINLNQDNPDRTFIEIPKPQNGVRYVLYAESTEVMASAYQKDKVLAPDKDANSDNANTAFRVEVDMIPNIQNKETEPIIFDVSGTNVFDVFRVEAQKLNTGITSPCSDY